MDAKHFEGVNVIMGENQEEYTDLPAYHNKEENSLTFCFKPSTEDILKIYDSGEIWFKQMIPASGMMNPILVTANKEDVIPKK